MRNSTRVNNIQVQVQYSTEYPHVAADRMQLGWMGNHMILKELGIKIMGDMLTILKLTKELLVSPASHIKPPTAKLSQLSLEMKTQQIWKFRIDWDIFTRMTNLLTAQTNVQLYNCADETVQNSIINAYPEFFNTSPNKLLDMLEVLVT